MADRAKLPDARLSKLRRRAVQIEVEAWNGKPGWTLSATALAEKLGSVTPRAVRYWRDRPDYLEAFNCAMASHRGRQRDVLRRALCARQELVPDALRARVPASGGVKGVVSPLTARC